MKALSLLALVVIIVADASSPAAAQALPTEYRVGLLSTGSEATDRSAFSTELIEGFARRGLIVGQNLVVEGQAAQGQLDRLPQLVQKLAASRVGVIVTLGYPAALAAKEHTTLPVVVVRAGDPVADGLVANFAHPGGHVTGLSEGAAELSTKRLTLLKEAVPKVRRVAMLWNAEDLGMSLRYKAADAEARRLGLRVDSYGVGAPDDFETTFVAMMRHPPDAILMVTDALTNLKRKQVIDFAAQHKLPAIYEYDFLVREGGLMSYGPELGEMFDRAAGLAVRILRGADPAELPLETPSRFVLAINLATAGKIGVKFPPSLLARADGVIE
ncbi:MAG TPA: ABC transporter substrate-binding protein [Stellaceae bacterium]